jgi:hypothetical protein
MSKWPLRALTTLSAIIVSHTWASPLPPESFQVPVFLGGAHMESLRRSALRETFEDGSEPRRRCLVQFKHQVQRVILGGADNARQSKTGRIDMQ